MILTQKQQMPPPLLIPIILIDLRITLVSMPADPDDDPLISWSRQSTPWLCDALEAAIDEHGGWLKVTEVSEKEGKPSCLTGCPRSKGLMVPSTSS